MMKTKVRLSSKLCAAIMLFALLLTAVFGVSFAFVAKAAEQKSVFNVKEAFEGATFDDTNWQVIVKKPADAEFSLMNSYAPMGDWYFTGQAKTLNAMKYIPESATDPVEYLSAWGGEWLSNNGEYISGYKFTAPKAGTVYIKDLVQSKANNYARYKIVKKSGAASTAVYPLTGGDADGYISVVGAADSAGSALVKASAELALGDELLFIAGELNKQILTAPTVSYEPFKDEYALTEYFGNYTFMHRGGEFDVLADNNGVELPLEKLDHQKLETDIAGKEHNAALYWTESVQYIGAFGNFYIHAGGNNQNIFYRFTAPKAGTVFIKDKISGNGEYKILHNTEKIYPLDADNKPANGSTGIDVSVKDIVLAQGDTLDFVVMGRGGSTKTHVEPIVSYEAYKDIVLDADKYTLESNESFTLTAALSALSGSSVIWESSAPELASVTPAENGESAVIKGLAEGSAVITVKSDDGEIVKTCSITIYPTVAPTDVINVDGGSYTCANAGSVYFALKTATAVSFDKLEIKKNGTTAVTVNNFSGTRLLTQLITVTNGDALTLVYTNASDFTGATQQLKYAVNNGIESDTIAFKTSNQLLSIGDKVKLSYAILPTASKDKEVVYSSNNVGVARIEGGELVAVAGGKAIVTVTVKDTEVSASIEVYVMTKGTYVYDSIKDFSNVPSPIWSYWYKNHPTALKPEPVKTPLTYNTQGLINEINEDGASVAGYKYVVGANFIEGAHKYLGIWNGEFMHPGDGADVIMEFKAPMKGRVNIYDTVKGLQGNSDGTIITVYKNDVKIFPSDAGDFLHKQSLSVIAIENIDLEKNDVISFVVNKNKTLASDLTYLNPTIYYTQCDAPEMRIELNATAKELKVGGLFLLEGKITPEIIVDNNFTFTSDNPAVATVEDGVVTAIAVGTATITVSHSSGISATCAVTVTAKDPPPPPIDGDKPKPGGCGTFSANDFNRPMFGTVLIFMGLCAFAVLMRSSKKQAVKKNNKK